MVNYMELIFVNSPYFNIYYYIAQGMSIVQPGVFSCDNFE